MLTDANILAKDQQARPKDARGLALLLIDRFGERAVSYAAHQSLKARSQGDARNAARWRSIADLALRLLRSDLDETADA
jgi:hypothetical protein